MRADLRRVAASGEDGARFGRKRRGSTRRRQLAREDVGDERLRRGIGRLEDDEAERSEQRLEPARERARHAGARLPRGPERAHHIRGEFRALQRRLEFPERLPDAFVQPQ